MQHGSSPPASELAAWYRNNISGKGNWSKAVEACSWALADVPSLYLLKRAGWRYLCTEAAGSSPEFRVQASTFYRKEWTLYLDKTETDYCQLPQDRVNQLLLSMSPSTQHPIVKCLPESMLKEWRQFFKAHWTLKSAIDNVVPIHYSPPGLMATSPVPKDRVLVETDF